MARDTLPLRPLPLPLLGKVERLLLAVDNPTPASPFTAQLLSCGPRVCSPPPPIVWASIAGGKSGS
jgi:hypothetical protein